MSAKRQRSDGWSLEVDRRNTTPLRLHRSKPINYPQADRRYKAHLNRGMCPLATTETAHRCPADFYEDFLSEQRLCLVYAVLVDDLYEQAGKQRKQSYLRRWTDDDGAWLPVATDVHGRAIEVARHTQPGGAIPIVEV